MEGKSSLSEKYFPNFFGDSGFLFTFALGYKTMVDHPLGRTSDAQHHSRAFFMPIGFPPTGVIYLIRLPFRKN